MNEFFSVLLQILIVLDIVGIFVLFNMNFKIKTEVSKCSEKLERLLGTHYTFLNNPLLIPLSNFKNSTDKELNHLAKRIKFMRIFFVLVIVTFFVCGSLLFKYGDR